MFRAIAQERDAVGQGEGELPELGRRVVQWEVEIAGDIVLDIADRLIGGIAAAGERSEFEGGDLRLPIMRRSAFQFGFRFGVESCGGEDFGAGDAFLGEGVRLEVRRRRQGGARQAFEKAEERGRRGRRWRIEGGEAGAGEDSVIGVRVPGSYKTVEGGCLGCVTA